MKNWEPLVSTSVVSVPILQLALMPDNRVDVLGPALAMESRNGRSCFLGKASSSNLAP